MKVLFVCWGSTDGLSHWRSFVPARAMKADIVCIDMTGKVVYQDALLGLGQYDVAVVQTCWYEWQEKVIKRLRMTGCKVLLNVDDWIRGIGRRAKGSHPGSMWYDFTKPEVLERHERILRQADGILASTPILAEKLETFNDVGLAPNGLDLDRYKPWRDPVRDDGIIIGWAGGVGHTDVIREIAPAVQEAIHDLNAQSIPTKLCVVGQDEREAFGLPSALHMKWADKYIYPQYLSCFDISLAPSREDSFYRYKSQLRLYEGAALGTPTLGGALYAPEMAGFGALCGKPETWYDKIMEYGASPTIRDETRQYCYDNIERFTIEERIGTWETSIQSLCG